MFFVTEELQYVDFFIVGWIFHNIYNDSSFPRNCVFLFL